MHFSSRSTNPRPLPQFPWPELQHRKEWEESKGGGAPRSGLKPQAGPGAKRRGVIPAPSSLPGGSAPALAEAKPGRGEGSRPGLRQVSDGNGQEFL